MPISPPVPVSSSRRIGGPLIESPVHQEIGEALQNNDGDVMFESMAEERMREWRPPGTDRPISSSQAQDLKNPVNFDMHTDLAIHEKKQKTDIERRGQLIDEHHSLTKGKKSRYDIYSKKSKSSLSNPRNLDCNSSRELSIALEAVKSLKLPDQLPSPKT